MYVCSRDILKFFEYLHIFAYIKLDLNPIAVNVLDRNNEKGIKRLCRKLSLCRK